MKKCSKGIAPDLLALYQFENPNATWEQFKSECQEGYQALQEQLRLDQGNLCCYCEIDTKQGFGMGIDDFRVEHFHPKSATDESHSNWSLDWQNMLGCCHGGSERYVTDNATRFVTEHTERHSDVLKANFIWDDEILNPLQIPVFPILFKANRKDGRLSVHNNDCRDAGVSIEKVNNCLHPEKLNLNSDRLNSLRKATLDALNEQITMALSSGLTIEDAMVNLAKAQLCKNNNGHWPPFFTTIRSYLGQIAEKHLITIDFNG